VYAVISVRDIKDRDIQLKPATIETLNMDNEILTPESIQRDLHTRFIGQKIVYYPSLNSTMEAAKKEALWGAEAGTVIVAGEQTTGRGRLQRTWVSPPGSLAFSVILRPNLIFLPYIIMLTSLAVTYGIRLSTGLKAQIKWPNDVLIGEKKICGILIENDIRKNILKHTVVGIGINVNLEVAKYPEIAAIATSLSDQLNQQVSRLEILRSVLMEMDSLYSELPQSSLLLNQWKNNLVTLGQQIQINQGNQTYTGLAESVMDDGSLMLRQKDGRLVKIIAGEVLFQ
jgi:BirA family transcriptional regulator, biotin operon repressor / biotin---[acetyl-CoA-carboxylase] ligase